MTLMVGTEAEALMTWQGLLAAFEAGHAMGRAEIADLFLYRDQNVMLDRAAWITGLGSLVKVDGACGQRGAWVADGQWGCGLVR